MDENPVPSTDRARALACLSAPLVSDTDSMQSDALRSYCKESRGRAGTLHIVLSVPLVMVATLLCETVPLQYRGVPVVQIIPSPHPC